MCHNVSQCVTKCHVKSLAYEYESENKKQSSPRLLHVFWLITLWTSMKYVTRLTSFSSLFSSLLCSAARHFSSSSSLFFCSSAAFISAWKHQVLWLNSFPPTTCRQTITTCYHVTKHFSAPEHDFPISHQLLLLLLSLELLDVLPPLCALAGAGLHGWGIRVSLLFSGEHMCIFHQDLYLLTFWCIMAEEIHHRHFTTSQHKKTGQYDDCPSSDSLCM